MSHYLFGLHLDGVTAPDNHQGLQSSVCGPENLLSALEASLGLPPSEASSLELTLAYRNVIATSLTEDAFYARSFQCDPLATARLLLSWRDTLCESGWHADLDHQSAPPRLQAVAALEAAFCETGFSQTSHAGRIAAILAELALGASPATPLLISRLYRQCKNRLIA